jgi:hypothetical protein
MSDVIWVLLNTSDSRANADMFELLMLKTTAYARANQQAIKTPSLASDGGKVVKGKGQQKGAGGDGASSSSWNNDKWSQQQQWWSK